MWLEKKAIPSGCIAATVFGVTSANMSTANVNNIVPINIPASP